MITLTGHYKKPHSAIFKDKLPPRIIRPKYYPNVFSEYSDVIYQNNRNVIQSKTISFIFLNSEFYFLFFIYKDAVHA